MTTPGDFRWNIGCKPSQKGRWSWWQGVAPSPGTGQACIFPLNFFFSNAPDYSHQFKEMAFPSLGWTSIIKSQNEFRVKDRLGNETHLISSCAARATTFSVRRFTVPSWSSGPQRPHAHPLKSWNRGSRSNSGSTLSWESVIFNEARWDENDWRRSRIISVTLIMAKGSERFRVNHTYQKVTGFEMIWNDSWWSN
jgi:hypothetical protein